MGRISEDALGSSAIRMLEKTCARSATRTAAMSAAAADANTWSALLVPALRLIDDLDAAGYGRLDFRLGGGTTLMLALRHRISKDIAIVFDDAQALGFLSPRLNEAAAALARDYAEQGNSLKLVLDAGDIDFIVAGTVMPGEPRGTLDFHGRSIPLDPVSEVLAKKLLYRAASFKPRDVFDLAAVLEQDRPSATAALLATRSMSDVLLRRVDALGRLDPEQHRADIHPIGEAASLLDRMIETVKTAVVASRDGAPT